MSKHTSEPWLAFVDCCEPATPHPDSDGVVRLGFEDYRRARACVNACRGLPTEDLEATGLVSVVGDQLLELESQLNEVLEVLGTVGVHTITDEDGCEIEVLYGDIGRIQEMISKHEA